VPLQLFDDRQGFFQRVLAFEPILYARQPVEVENKVDLSLQIAGIGGDETADDRQPIRVKTASGGSVAQAELGLAQLVERDLRVGLPQRIARIARCQSACDRQRLVIARGRSPGIASLQFGVAELLQHDGHIPQPERIVRVVFGQPADIC